MPGIYFVGVDVGTGSARAALVNSHGRVIKTHVKTIQTWSPIPDHYEQSSNDIWSAICECVRVSYIKIKFGVQYLFMEMKVITNASTDNCFFDLKFTSYRRLLKVIQVMKSLESVLMLHAHWLLWTKIMSPYQLAQQVCQL